MIQKILVLAHLSLSFLIPVNVFILKRTCVISSIFSVSLNIWKMGRFLGGTDTTEELDFFRQSP